MMNREVPYLLSQCPQPVGLQATRGWGRKEGIYQANDRRDTDRRHTQNNEWDEEKGRMGVGENAESREQSKNKIKTMSNVETIKINHYTVKDGKKLKRCQHIHRAQNRNR